MITMTPPIPFSDRMKNIPESFIREILKVSTKPEMISFAGGLPNPRFFPVEKIADAAEKVLRKDGTSALQYWVTEGYLPLRDYIAQWQSEKKRQKNFCRRSSDVEWLATGTRPGRKIIYEPR